VSFISAHVHSKLKYNYQEIIVNTNAAKVTDKIL
jgi:hypothetical protein